jgi:hypothetical protein
VEQEQLQRTVWRIEAIPERSGLNVLVLADTTADAVVEAIEQAAEQNGIKLVRLSKTKP